MGATAVGGDHEGTQGVQGKVHGRRVLPRAVPQALAVLTREVRHCEANLGLPQEVWP